jgi:integrase
MPVRARNGKLEWRFQVSGHEYSHITDLGDTERNRIKVARMEAAARALVLEGRAAELCLQVEPFASAADAFVTWAKGEYADHPGSWKRLSVSMTCLKLFFGKRPLSTITAGDCEDFKAWRRRVHKVREVTIRHDLHALSLLFQYGQKHHWCKTNPVLEVEIPSDADAVRINVLSPADEARLFAALDALELETRSKRMRQGCRDLRDLCTLMLNQGCRPEELRELHQSDVDLERGEFRITRGKSKAARRTLPMTSGSRSVFATRLQARNSWIFPGRPGKHIGQHQRLWDRAIQRAGLTCVPYDLRHTFATRAVERGVDLPRLAAILGHANLRSIMKYVHMTQGHIEEGMRRFEASEHESKAKEGNVTVQ